MIASTVLWFFFASTTPDQWDRVGYFASKGECEEYRITMTQRHLSKGLKIETQACQREWRE